MLGGRVHPDFVLTGGGEGEEGFVLLPTPSGPGVLDFEVLSFFGSYCASP